MIKLFSSKESRHSEVAQEIAEEFRSGEIVKQELDPHGISFLGIKYLDEKVIVSWYPRGDTRDISIGGKRMFGGKDGELILSAAVDRANALLEEELKRLDQKRRDRAAPQSFVKTD